MAASSREAELTRQAPFVFKGTVQKLKATATQEGASATPRTAVVRVDEVIKSSPLLARYAGAEITVEMEAGDEPGEGARAIFYADDVRFGESVTVRAIGHSDPDAADAASVAPPHTSSADTETRELQDHLADADTVVTGKVLSVGLAKEPESRARGGGLPATSRVSEHSARWREAVIAVRSVDKGGLAVKRLVVRFPASEDVAWAHAPKFQAGQEGVFILHKTAPEEGASNSKRSADTDDPTQTYTAQHAQDFQPLHQAARIKSLIEAPATKTQAKRAPTKK